MYTFRSLKLRCFTNSLIKESARKFSLSATRTLGYESTLAETFYNEEQRELQKSVRKFIDQHVNPFVDEWEKKEQVPTHHLFKLAGEMGFLGINRPTEYGGLGLDYKHHAAWLEEGGTGNAQGAIVPFTIHTDMALPALTNFGSHELKTEYLVPALKGDTVACIGVSEPQAGSDVASLKATAKRDGDDLIINGEKVWISSGIQADWMCLLANTSQGNPYRNKTLIIVPLNQKGITRRNIKKIGMKSIDWAHIYLEDVRVPVKNIIGEEGKGFYYQMQQFQDERLAVVLGTLKLYDKAISITVDYTNNRQAFGKSILDNQVVHYRLSELAVEVESLRALTYQAVERRTAGNDITLLASMAKYKCGQLAREVMDTCLQFWGGMGYSQETLISRLYLDARQYAVAGGADEIMLGIISKMLGMAPKN